MLDKKREMYEFLTAEEKAEFRESIRLFRHPKYSKNKGEFHHTSEPQNQDDTYSLYTAEFKNRMKEIYGISFDRTDEKKKSEAPFESVLTDTDTDCDKTIGTEESNFPKRRNAFRQDSLSKYAKNVRGNLETNHSSKHIEPHGVPEESIIEKRGVPIDSTYEPKVQFNATGNMKMKSENVYYKDEIDDIISNMQTPNPENEYYARCGPAIHKLTEDAYEEMRQVNASRSGWEKIKREKHPDEFQGLDSNNPIYYKDIHSDYDPLMGNQSKISRETTSYFNTWKKNIDEERKKSSSVKSEDGLSLLKSKMFITLAFISFLSLGAILVNMVSSEDVPMNANNDKKQTSDNKQ